MATAKYKPNLEATTRERITALVTAFPTIATDFDEIAASLVDEDEAAFPGSWAAIGYDRGGAISEYLYEIEDMQEERIS